MSYMLIWDEAMGEEITPEEWLARRNESADIRAARARVREAMTYTRGPKPTTRTGRRRRARALAELDAAQAALTHLLRGVAIAHLLMLDGEDGEE